ncbi:MAG: 5-oxoprolinase subunit PxpA [bacterium]
MTQIDLNSDLGESFGPWTMGDDAAMLSVVSSANVACGGHASDPETMFATLSTAHSKGVIIGAHPGYTDRIGFGRRVIPMTAAEIERMTAAQIGALIGVAGLAGARVRYVKAHGALANLAADDRTVADALARAVKAVAPDLAYLAISGTHQEAAAKAAGLQTYSEIFADRGYQPNGRLVPRSHPGAMIHDPALATDRLLRFLDTGLMPVVGGDPIRLCAQSICVHSDSPGSVAMARHIAKTFATAGIAIKPFLAP